MSKKPRKLWVARDQQTLGELEDPCFLHVVKPRAKRLFLRHGVDFDSGPLHEAYGLPDVMVEAMVPGGVKPGKCVEISVTVKRAEP